MKENFGPPAFLRCSRPRRCSFGQVAVKCGSMFSLMRIDLAAFGVVHPQGLDGADHNAQLVRGCREGRIVVKSAMSNDPHAARRRPHRVPAGKDAACSSNASTVCSSDRLRRERAKEREDNPSRSRRRARYRWHARRGSSFRLRSAGGGICKASAGSLRVVGIVAAYRPRRLRLLRFFGDRLVGVLRVRQREPLRGIVAGLRGLAD